MSKELALMGGLSGGTASKVRESADGKNGLSRPVWGWLGVSSSRWRRSRRSWEESNTVGCLHGGFATTQ